MAIGDPRPKQLETLIFALAVALLLHGSVPAETEFADPEKERAERLIEQLGSENFSARIAAGAELEDLPAGALPWLEEAIDRCDPGAVDLRSRLKAIVRKLKLRVSEKLLRTGTPVKIDLEAAAPEDVMESLKLAAGISLSGVRMAKIWDDQSERNFSFEGSYWGAVNEMVDVFPPGEAVRENLGAEYRLGRWGELDFRAAGQPSASVGILRVRHARMALENSGGKDFLALTLVPNIEPCYQVESLALLVRGLTLEDGTVIEPEKKVKDWKAQFSGAKYSPGGIYTWIFPLEKGIKLKGVAGIEGAAELVVRRNVWCEVDLPEDLDEAVPMNSSVELKVLERGDGRLKIQFEGEGSEPACFDDYELRKESYQVLDKDGGVLEFGVNSSSSGGGRGWRNSYAGKIKGEPAKVRANLPSGEQKVELSFQLSELAMPGSSLKE